MHTHWYQRNKFTIRSMRKISKPNVFDGSAKGPLWVLIGRQWLAVLFHGNGNNAKLVKCTFNRCNRRPCNRCDHTWSTHWLATCSPSQAAGKMHISDNNVPFGVAPGEHSCEPIFWTWTGLHTHPNSVTMAISRARACDIMLVSLMRSTDAKMLTANFLQRLVANHFAGRQQIFVAAVFGASRRIEHGERLFKGQLGQFWLAKESE